MMKSAQIRNEAFVASLTPANNVIHFPVVREKDRWKALNYTISHLTLSNFNLNEQSVEDDKKTVHVVAIMYPKSADGKKTGCETRFISLNPAQSPLKTLNLSHNVPVVIKLVRGDGPVYITGYSFLKQLKIRTAPENSTAPISVEKPMQHVSPVTAPAPISCTEFRDQVPKKPGLSSDDELELSENEYQRLELIFIERLRRKNLPQNKMKYSVKEMKRLIDRRKENSSLPKSLNALSEVAKNQFKTNDGKVIRELWSYINTV